MLTFKLQTFNDLSSKQLYEILFQRQQVFVVEQQCAYADIDTSDLIAYHLQGMSATHQLVCYARILPPSPKHKNLPAIGRVLVNPNWRGQGLAYRLMQQAITCCQQQFPNQSIYLSAQTYLLTFYQSLGFIVDGQPYLEDGIEHINMLYPMEQR